MDKIDNTQADAVMHEHEDEDLMMSEVVQDDPELMYLHVCLSEILCKPEESA
ncbi:MAG: hypothetical protein LIO77_03315 [Rikenellaceae bacterium]|nr:hypothetical protein [Rikenellaceae bacterium]